MATVSTVTAARTGIARAGSEPTWTFQGLTLAKPLESSGFSLFWACGRTLENMRHIACQTRIALLNDRPRKAFTAFRAHSSVGRAADS